MKKTLIARTITAALVAVPVAAFASEAELSQRLEKLSAELEQVKAELAATRQKTEAAEKQQQAATEAAPAVAEAAASGEKTVLTGYGEVNYNRPTSDASQARADVRRAVIGVEHRFDEKTRLVTEFEWEHAVVSADDQGESEVEQAYIEHEIGNGLRAKAGLFLIPAGLLNQNHEPTAYYGVERNFVETAIIPTTWREAGVGLSGEMDNGLSWDAGITTTFDLNKWDAESEEGRESPLGSIHQEGQLAKARNAGLYGALNWRGVPGLLVGGSAFTSKVGQGNDSFAAPDARLTLWDLHTRYTPGAWDLSALYARGTFTNVAALNDTFAGKATPVPSSFYGWYMQAAYQALKTNNYALSPFVRYERFNTAQSYSAVPAGLAVATTPAQGVTTAGLNFRVGEGVVLKADYQRFKENDSNNRVNLGVGYSF